MAHPVCWGGRGGGGGGVVKSFCNQKALFGKSPNNNTIASTITAKLKKNMMCFFNYKYVDNAILKIIKSFICYINILLEKGRVLLRMSNLADLCSTGLP